MVGSVLKKVFSKPFYLVLAPVLALLLLFVIVWIPNLKLIGIYMQSEVTVGQKLSFLFGFLQSLSTTFTLANATFTVIIALLFGINVSLIVYYLSRASKVNMNGGDSILRIGGLFIGMLGMGCASCGALILTPILGTAAAGYIATLPFQGNELAIIGIVILLWSTYSLIKKIHNPYV